MFWDKLIPQNYHYKRDVCAVEVVFSDTATHYYYSHLKTKGSQLEVIASDAFSEWSELPKNISKNKVPVVLIINGKGIILKKIDWTENTAQKLALNQLVETHLPAINANEFYIQLYEQAGNSGFLALCRKEQADLVLATCKDKVTDLAEVYIGVPVVLAMQAIWQNYNVLPTTFHTVQLTNNVIDTIVTRGETTPEDFKAEGLQLAAHQVLSFAAAMAYLTKQRVVEHLHPTWQSINVLHIERNKFRFLQILVVAIALVLALSNVFFYSRYFNANNAIDTELNVYQGKNDEINRLLNDYQSKKDLIESAGVLTKNSVSEYADRIAATMPNGVVLTELVFNPPIQSDDDTLVSYRKNNITIKGRCNKSLIVNEWENVLKMQTFIKDVALEKFSYNNEGVLPNFEIKIITND